MIGTPHQIGLIVKTKTVHNVSLLRCSIVLVTYALWVVHGVLRQDMTVVISQSVGVVVSATLLGYIVYYKHFYDQE